MQARLFPKPHLPVRINDRFNEVNNLVDITDENVFLAHPSSMLEVFYLLSQRSDLKNMTARTLRAMWHARIHIDRTFRNDSTNQSFFLRILKSPRFAARALRHMNELGILAGICPVLEKSSARCNTIFSINIRLTSIS